MSKRSGRDLWPQSRGDLPLAPGSSGTCGTPSELRTSSSRVAASRPVPGSCPAAPPPDGGSARLGERSRLWVDLHRTTASMVMYANPPDLPEMLVWRRALRDDGLFVDVGANAGTYTLWAAELGTEIIALEPAAGIFSPLQENIALNGFAPPPAMTAGPPGSRRTWTRAIPSLRTNLCSRIRCVPRPIRRGVLRGYASRLFAASMAFTLNSGARHSLLPPEGKTSNDAAGFALCCGPHRRSPPASDDELTNTKSHRAYVTVSPPIPLGARKIRASKTQYHLNRLL
jgi:hypothetical protein